MADKWNLRGNWINSCSCDSGCPCLFYSDPTKGYCEAMDAFQIESGSYGKTSLNGLNVVIASRSPGNFWKGNWAAAVYFDERANPDQREALGTLFGGKAGGALAMIASLISNMKGIKYAAVQIDAKTHRVGIPGILEYVVKDTEGGQKEKPIMVVNHPFSPAMESMVMAVSTKSTFKDYDMSFDNTGKDANYAAFNFEGP